MQTENLDVVYVARRPLQAGDDVIQVGQLVDTTGWPERITRIYVEQGLIASLLVTAASRDEITAQWEAEEAQREERRQAAPEPEPAPPPEPPKPPARRLYCWNCSAANDFMEVPEDDLQFQCVGCNQVQRVREASRSSGYGTHGGVW